MFLNKHTYFEYFNEPNNISSLQYFDFCQTKLNYPPSNYGLMKKRYLRLQQLGLIILISS